MADWGDQGEASLPSRQNELDRNNSKGQCRLNEIDDDDNLPFSREIQSFLMLANFMPHKIPKYKGKDSQEKRLNKYMTQLSLRGAFPELKCRAFHLTLTRVAQVWYNLLPPLGIISWLKLKKAFLN